MLSPLDAFLDAIGLSAGERLLFITIYQYGPKAASTFAKIIGIERTNTYKMVQKLVADGLVHETTLRGVKQFFVPSIDILQQCIDNKKAEAERLIAIHDQAKTELIGHQQHGLSVLPRMSLYEGPMGLRNLFNELQQLITTTAIRQIKFFASNTLDMQSQSPHSINDITGDFISFLRQEHISIDMITAEGIMLMEHLVHKVVSDIPSRLPAGHSAINCFVIGSTICFIVYKTIPYAIKIDSDEITQMLCALWKVVEK